MIFNAFATLGVFRDAAALNLFDLLYQIKIDTIGVVDPTRGVRKRNNLSTKLLGFFGCVDSNIAGTRNRNSLALERVTLALEVFLHKINQVIASGLGTSQGTAIGQALASENAFPNIANTLVLAEHIANLASTGSNIASRNVGVGANVLAKFSHERLAETHNLCVGLALGIEVGSTLAAAHRKRGEAVLENLLKAKELDNAQVYRGMEAKTALVRSKTAIELHAEAAVNLHLARIINPRNTEHNNALGLYNSLKQTCLLILGIRVDDRLQRRKNLGNSLNKLRLVCVLGLYLLDDGVNVAHGTSFIETQRDQ